MTYYSFEDSTFNNKISLTLSEILLFSVSLSVSDDSLATFSMFNQETDQKLISITFGEGILNSGICISMFNIILGYHLDKGELNLTAKLIWNTLKKTFKNRTKTEIFAGEAAAACYDHGVTKGMIFEKK